MGKSSVIPRVLKSGSGEIETILANTVKPVSTKNTKDELGVVVGASSPSYSGG